MRELHVAVNCSQLDEAIEKANRLIALLQEAQTLIDSLSVQKTAINNYQN